MTALNPESGKKRLAGTPADLALLPAAVARSRHDSAGVVLRWIIAGSVREGIGSAPQDEDRLAILQRRYARGEIDEAEYERRRQMLAK